MEHALNPPMASPPPPPPHQRNFSPFYYSVIAIASTAILLIAYNLCVIGWCWQHHRNRRLSTSTGNHCGEIENPSLELILVYKYQKEGTPTQASDNECSVCLSVFLEGEELRQLPVCRHPFHVACIDMWLSSHSSCPLCRAIVSVPRPQILTSSDLNNDFPRPGFPNAVANVLSFS